MRLKHTTFAAVCVLALSGSAMAASTSRNSISTDLGGTPHLHAGGKVTLISMHKPGAKKLKVTINYNVVVRSRMVLGFAAYPCRSTSCDGQSSDRITLGGGQRRVTFHGTIPYVKSKGRACVYAQLRDLGPKGKGPGSIVHNGKLKGVSLCQSK